MIYKKLFYKFKDKLRRYRSRHSKLCLKRKINTGKTSNSSTTRRLRERNPTAEGCLLLVPPTLRIPVKILGFVDRTNFVMARLASTLDFATVFPRPRGTDSRASRLREPANSRKIRASIGRSARVNNLCTCNPSTLFNLLECTCDENDTFITFLKRF